MLYAIGDLHLSLETSKPMDIFGASWENHTEKLKNGFSRVTDNDTCVICGDLTWGMDMKGCLADFKFINDLPGKKIILKGNHDYWWTTASKTRKFFAENGIDTIDILNNNCFFYEDTALCGTRGWVIAPTGEHDKKIAQREVLRLEASLKAAGETKEKYCFLHYPPIFQNTVYRDLVDLMKSHNVTKCFYGHLHGPSIALAYEGIFEGIEYTLVSADRVNFTPVMIM